MKTEILGKAFVQVLSSVLLMCFNELAKYRTLKPKEKQRKWRPRKKKATDGDAGNSFESNHFRYSLHNDLRRPQ